MIRRAFARSAAAAPLALLPAATPRPGLIELDVPTWNALPREAMRAWHLAQGLPYGQREYHVTVDPQAMTATVYRFWTRGGTGAWSDTTWRGIQLDSGFWLVGPQKPEWVRDHHYRQEPIQAQPETYRITTIPPFLLDLAGRTPERWAPPGPRMRVTGALAGLVQQHLVRQTDREIARFGETARRLAHRYG